MENSITQDQYDDAIMRGDVAMTALRAVRGSAQQGQVRLLTVVERLQKLNMPMETQDGKPTVGRILMDELAIINETLTNAFSTADSTLKELDALYEQYQFGTGSVEESIDKVIAKIKLTIPKYAKMSDDEVKKELGL